MRARLEAGTELVAVAVAVASVVASVVEESWFWFLSWCVPGERTPDPADSSPPSSPDASRDEGCRRSALDEECLGTWTERLCEALRLRLPAEVGEEDMVA